MRHALIVLLLVGWVFGVAVPGVAQASNVASTVTPPPAIYLPAGGNVVTEINVSDSDVLGIIKQAIPAVGDVVKDIAPQVGGPDGKMAAAVASAADPAGLSQAIEGIKNVRFVIARYPASVSPQKFVAEFDKGAAKAGPFSKILSDFGFFPGAVAIYALPNNAGCMGFVYIPSERTVYAARVVGGLDVPKLIKWAGGIAKVVCGAHAASMIEQPVAQPAPASGTPEPAESK